MIGVMVRGGGRAGDLSTIAEVSGRWRDGESVGDETGVGCCPGVAAHDSLGVRWLDRPTLPGTVLRETKRASGQGDRYCGEASAQTTPIWQHVYHELPHHNTPGASHHINVAPHVPASNAD